MRVSLRTRKLGYSLATLACLAGSALPVFETVYHADAPVTPAPIKTANGTPATAVDEDHAPSSDELVKLCGIQLRRPLYDPPPAPPVVKQLPPLQVEVLGTILEDANSVALVRGGPGGMEYKRVGDAVGPADSPGKLIEIADSSITIERGAERVTLRVNQSQQH